MGEIEITVSKFLPKTVKNKDGKEVKLLGVFVSEHPAPFLLPYEDALKAMVPRIVLITE